MITVICDGCGKPSPEYKERGLVKLCQYCPACDTLYQGYVMERDEIHDHVQMTWTNSIKALDRSFREQLNALPDA